MSAEAELHRRAKEILLAALERDAAERERFVAGACAGDRELEVEVWSLLARDDERDDLLERPPLPLRASSRSGSVPAEPDGPFAAGDLVAQRFEIVRLLGAGGMGVVYEAWDRELRGAVALKVVREEHQQDPDRRARLRRELVLARRVTHPNVCRVFDVVQHSVASDPDRPVSDLPQPVTVLVMELLRGESLAERLESSGPLAPSAAEPLLAQIASGLDAAHRAGVVHRDFKASNVMLVPAEGGSERAVITDFGVAHATGSAMQDGGATTITGSGEVVGTPAYMAPEQLLGHDATPASDLYALGVVAYEVLTGEKPFVGATPFSAAARRLTEEPRPLEALLPNLDARWRKAVERCLERDPDDRFRSAADFVAAIGGERVPGPRGARARARRLTLAAATAALVLLAVTAGLAWRFASAAARLEGDGSGARVERAPAPAERARAAAARPAVAVLDLTGDAERLPAWLALSATELLSAELGAGSALAVIPRDRVADVERDLSAGSDASSLAESTAALRAATGADFLVAGRLELAAAPDETLSLEVRLIDAATGAEATRVTELGSSTELAAMGGRAADRLRAALRVGHPTPEERRAALARLPASSEASQPYAEGLERLRAHDARAARELFEQAITAEPDWALGHLALAEAWEALGFEVRAREAARRAYELRAPLPRPDQLFVEARFLGWSFEWERAMELYRALYTVFPDRVDIGLRLVTAQVAAGEAIAALATVETLRALPPPRGEDPRIDLAEGEAAWAASDWERHLRSARAAKRKAEELGLVGLGAAAACEEGWALRYSGELVPAAQAGETCLERWGKAGNPGGEADALNFLATVDLDRGDFERAARRYRESAALERRLGNLGGVAVASSNLGNALSDAGDLDGAAALYAEALDLFEQVGRREGVGMMLNALGNVALAAARLAEARERYGAALQVGRELDAKRLVALALNNLGNTALQTAELEAAQRSFDESLALCRELGHPRIEAYDLYGLGEVAFWRGDLATARGRHREALALRETAGEELLVAESRLALARVGLESGEPDTAAREVAKARAVFERLGVAASEAQALAVESRALASLGREAEARAAAERAVERATAAASPVAKLEAGLALAMADVRAGDMDSAAVALERLGDEAAALGLVTLRLEATCLAGSIDPGRARDAGGGSRARSPVEEARALGLGLVASHCARQDSPPPS